MICPGFSRIVFVLFHNFFYLTGIMNRAIYSIASSESVNKINTKTTFFSQQSVSINTMKSKHCFDELPEQEKSVRPKSPLQGDRGKIICTFDVYSLICALQIIALTDARRA